MLSRQWSRISEANCARLEGSFIRTKKGLRNGFLQIRRGIRENSEGDAKWRKLEDMVARIAREGSSVRKVCCLW